MLFSKKCIKTVSGVIISLSLSSAVYADTSYYLFGTKDPRAKYIPDEIAFMALIALKDLVESNPFIIVDGIKSSVSTSSLPSSNQPTLEVGGTNLGIENCFSRSQDFSSAQEISSTPAQDAEFLTKRKEEFSKFEQEFKISPQSPQWNPQFSECKKVLEAYDHYANKAFIAWIKDAPGYEDTIRNLRREIDKKNSKVRKQLKNVPGFTYKTKYWWTFGALGSHKSHYGFHDFIRSEDNRIQREREIKAKYAQEFYAREEESRKAQEAYYEQEHTRAHYAQNEIFTQQAEWINHELEERCSYNDVVVSQEQEQLLESSLRNSYAFDANHENKIYRDKGLSLLQGTHLAQNNFQYTTSKTRAEALLNTIQTKGATSVGHYALSTCARYALAMHNLSAAEYASFSGNSITHCIQNELIHTLNENSLLAYSFKQNAPISHITNIIFESIEVARLTNDGSNLDRSFALADWCSSLLNVGKQYGLVLSAGQDIALAATLAHTKASTLRGGEKFTTAWNDFAGKLATPSVIIEDYKRAVTDATNVLSKIVLCVYNDPVEIKHPLLKIIN